MSSIINRIQNVTPYAPNESLTNSTDYILLATQQTDAVSGGYYGIFLMLTFLVFLFFVAISERGILRLDWVQAAIFSSGLTLVLFTPMLFFGFVNDYSVIGVPATILAIFTIVEFIKRRSN